MKNYISTAVTLLVILSGFAVSCQKEDVSPVDPFAESLDGTVWEGEFLGIVSDEFPGNPEIGYPGDTIVYNVVRMCFLSESTKFAVVIIDCALGIKKTDDGTYKPRVVCPIYYGYAYGYDGYRFDPLKSELSDNDPSWRLYTRNGTVFEPSASIISHIMEDCSRNTGDMITPVTENLGRLTCIGTLADVGYTEDIADRDVWLQILFDEHSNRLGPRK